MADSIVLDSSRENLIKDLADSVPFQALNGDFSGVELVPIRDNVIFSVEKDDNWGSTKSIHEDGKRIYCAEMPVTDKECWVQYLGDTYADQIRKNYGLPSRQYLPSGGWQACPVEWLVDAIEAKFCGSFVKSASRTHTPSLTIQDFRAGANKKPAQDLKGESLYQYRLAAELNGDIEVDVPCGRIDVLTESEIIEVKEIGGWKSAIGQVLSYGIYYPDRAKRIYLFGKCSKDKKVLIRNHCKPLDISVSFSH